MQKNIVYYGKTSLSTCSTLFMKLFQNYDFEQPFYNYITTEVFNYQGFFYDHRQWYCSFPYGISAIQTGLKIMGIEAEIFIHNTNTSCKSILDKQIEAYVKKGSCILGPVDLSSIWNKIDSRYFRGYAQFVYIIGTKNNRFVLQDANGSPFMFVTKEMLWQMVENFNEISLVSFDDTDYRSRNLKVMCIDILKQVLSNRVKLIDDPNNFQLCIKKIHQKFTNQGIKSSEMLSIKYVLCFLCRSLYFWIEFFECFQKKCDFYDTNHNIGNTIKLLKEYIVKVNCVNHINYHDLNVGKISTELLFYEKILDDCSIVLQKEIGEIYV